MSEATKKHMRKSRYAIVVIILGISLMAFKIYEDSEPGAIPLLMIVIGISWLAFSRIRQPTQQQD